MPFVARYSLSWRVSSRRRPASLSLMDFVAGVCGCSMPKSTPLQARGVGRFVSRQVVSAAPSNRRM